MRVAKDVRAAHPSARSYRLAFVGYRDYGDSVRFEVQHFTSDVQAVEARLERVEAKGGDDAAEDVAGGLQQALGLDWAGDVRVLFHVADAPAHGAAFHGPLLSDRYPGGDPDGRDPRELLKQLAGRAVDYTFTKCGTAHTDKMLEELHAAFTSVAAPERFVVLDLQPQTAVAAAAGEDALPPRARRALVRFDRCGPPTDPCRPDLPRGAHFFGGDPRARHVGFAMPAASLDRSPRLFDRHAGPAATACDDPGAESAMCGAPPARMFSHGEGEDGAADPEPLRSAARTRTHGHDDDEMAGMRSPVSAMFSAGLSATVSRSVAMTMSRSTALAIAQPAEH